jgi:hypothetical protein
MNINSLIFLILSIFGMHSLSLNAQNNISLIEQNTFESYLDISKNSPINKKEFSNKELTILYKKSANHPVSKLSAIDKYDPTGLIGFCFGRAMAAQLLARQMGLDPHSIQKVFIIGALCSTCSKPEDPIEWRFHVTTMVRGPKNQWYAIDPIYPQQNFKPVLASQWITFVRKGWDSYQSEPRAYLYSTNSSAIMPDIRTLPNPESGNHIIELNFKPDEHEIPRLSSQLLKNEYGITNNKEVIYSLNQEKADSLMLTAYHFDATNRFQFLDITINNTYLSYNGYFVDLISSLKPAYQNGFSDHLFNFQVQNDSIVTYPQKQLMGFNIKRILE